MFAQSIISLIITLIASFISHSNAQCTDQNPLTATHFTAGDGMTVSLTICTDNFFYLEIAFTQFTDKWFGIRFPKPFPSVGSKMVGRAVVYTTGKTGADPVALYAYTNSDSNLAGVAKDTSQFWELISEDNSNGLTIIYKISATNAESLYGWNSNTTSIPFYYLLGAASGSISLNSHKFPSVEGVLNFPIPVITTAAATTTADPSDPANVTIDDILLLQTILSDKFRNSGNLSPLAATTIRLVFDDCAGYPENATSGIPSICNGCIDFTSNDHGGFSGTNGDVVGVLEDIFMNQGPNGVTDDNKWQMKMSLADFWMAAGTIAIQYAQELSGQDILPTIPFYFGREECSTSPILNATLSTVKALPQAADGWDATETWFETNFDFTTEEIVAIIGAHTLGLKHSAITGMSGFWVQQWDKFDNQFYIDLINNDWVQSDNGQSNPPQWNSGGASMMNTDIGLWKLIEPELNETNGEVSCLFDECPDNNATRSIVQSFADDNALWLDTFVQAWIKMITVGYEDGELTEIIVDSVEETTTEFPSPDMSSTTISTTISTTAKPSELLDDAIEWVKENWYFVAGGVVVLILMIILCCCCCKKKKMQREKSQRHVEMFGQDATAV